MNAVAPLADPIPTPVAADVPVDLIDTQPGFNPRRVFLELEKLADSIRRRGVVQSIALRPREDAPGRYWLIAGERRLRAARMANVPLIPARIFFVDEIAAYDIAVAENDDRLGLSPGEEALNARRMLTAVHGDRDEAARRLGWGVKKFDARLLLTQATEAVLIALAEQRIQLGHAELLSTLPTVTQDGTLTELLRNTVENPPHPPRTAITVEQLRQRLASFALDLGTACFDLSGCRACPHNTTRQASLFEQNIGEGRCVNRPCFAEKTQKHLEELRPALRDRYNAVFLDTEVAQGQWAVLLKREVGPQQFETGCAQCAHFGCLLSSRPGDAGKITEEVCFDATCRAEKIAAHRAASATAAPKPAAPQSPTRTTTPTAEPRPTRPTEKPASAAPPRAVQERIHAIHRQAAAAEIRADAQMVQVYAVLALLTELGRLVLGSQKDDPLEKRGIRRALGTDECRSALIPQLYALPPAELVELTAELAAQVAYRENGPHTGNGYLTGVQATLRVLSVDLSKHFVVDADFLSLHTKSGIEGLLREAGFHTHCNRYDASAFKRLLNQTHQELVRKATDSGFDFRGFVPQALRIPAGVQIGAQDRD